MTNLNLIISKSNSFEIEEGKFFAEGDIEQTLIDLGFDQFFRQDGWAKFDETDGNKKQSIFVNIQAKTWIPAIV